MNRIIGTLLALIWVGAMAALVQRDVLPFWTAREPPRQCIPSGDYQIAIANAAGVRLGTTWIHTPTTAPPFVVRSTTVLDASRLGRLLPVTGKWILTSLLSYDREGSLGQFTFNLSASGLNVEVVADRLERDFSCVATIGGMRRSLLLDGELSQHLAETLRPFTHLRGLRIGQRWRIRLLDPLALMRGEGLEFQTQLAEVTAREMVAHRGRRVECFRIETPSAVAWADESGRVVRQEVQIPLAGRWVLTDEAYDAGQKREAMAGRKKERP